MEAPTAGADVRIEATLFADAMCPWGYSALPALRVLQWRYGASISWRLVVIGLAEDASVYEERGYTPARQAVGWMGFRRFGMPFAPEAKRRTSGTARACRAVVAARLQAPGSEWEVLRALQLANFTSGVLLDDDDDLRGVLEAAAIPGVDPAAVVGAIDSAEVTAAYEADKAEARAAACSPSATQGKTATYGGPERYTAPSVVFTRGGRTLEAGGFQPTAAYDVLVANLDPGIERRDVPDGPADLLAAFPEGLVTGEVAELLRRGNDEVDAAAAEAALLELAAAGGARRIALGDGALWVPVSA